MNKAQVNHTIKKQVRIALTEQRRILLIKFLKYKRLVKKSKSIHELNNFKIKLRQLEGIYTYDEIKLIAKHKKLNRKKPAYKVYKQTLKDYQVEQIRQDFYGNEEAVKKYLFNLKKDSVKLSVCNAVTKIRLTGKRKQAAQNKADVIHEQMFSLGNKLNDIKARPQRRKLKTLKDYCNKIDKKINENELKRILCECNNDVKISKKYILNRL